MSIDELVLAISEWASAALPTTEVKLLSPADIKAGDGVSLCIVGYRGVRDRRHALTRRDPVIDILEVEAVLAVGGPDPAMRARLCADLHFAALAGGPFTIAEPAETRSVLTDLGLPLGSGLLLRGEIARQRPEKPVPLVRETVFDVGDRHRGPDRAQPTQDAAARAQTEKTRRQAAPR